MWARLRYLVRQVRLKNQQQTLNGPAVRGPKELVQTHLSDLKPWDSYKMLRS